MGIRPTCRLDRRGFWVPPCCARITEEWGRHRLKRGGRGAPPRQRLDRAWGAIGVPCCPEEGERRRTNAWVGSHARGEVEGRESE